MSLHGFNSQAVTPPKTLGNTAFNTQTATRASNVASNRINSNILKAGNIGKLQAQQGAKGLENKRLQLVEERQRAVLDQRNDITTSIRYAKEDLQDYRTQLVMRMQEAQRQLSQQRADDKIAMQNFVTDFSDEQFGQAIQRGASGIASIGAAGIASATPKPGLSSSNFFAGNNPLTQTQSGGLLGTPLSQGAFGQQQPFQNINFNSPFSTGAGLQNALNTANVNPPQVGDIFSNLFQSPEISQRPGLFNKIFGGR